MLSPITFCFVVKYLFLNNVVMGRMSWKDKREAGLKEYNLKRNRPKRPKKGEKK
jgi:hypothetical protein